MRYEPGDLIMTCDVFGGAAWANKIGVYLEPVHDVTFENHAIHQVMVSGRIMRLLEWQIRKR